MSIAGTIILKLTAGYFAENVSRVRVNLVRHLTVAVHFTPI